MMASHAGLCVALVAGPLRRYHQRSAAARPNLPTSPPSPHRRANSRAWHRSTLVTMTAASDRIVSSRKLLIVGPGVLGSYLGKLWLEEATLAKHTNLSGAADVVGLTNTTNNHAGLKRLGIHPYTNEQAAEFMQRSSLENDFGTIYPFVAYAAPLSGSQDYVGDVKRALEFWDGTGAFVFTSSAGVYAVDDGSACSEDSLTTPLGTSERTDKLLLAEQAVLNAGGCVVRLAGLYHRDRGAHTFFLKQDQVPRWGGYSVNLIHYEDAASLVFATLAGQGSDSEAPRENLPSLRMYRGRMFLGCDNSPVTFEEMMAAVSASGELPGSCTFTGEEGPVKGKRMSNYATRAQLQWRPKYSSIVEFFNTGAKDWYHLEGVAPAGAAHAAEERRAAQGAGAASPAATA